MHSELSSAIMMQFLVFSNNFATTNLKYLKFGITHFFYVPWMIFVFSRPARPIRTRWTTFWPLFNFFWKFSKVYPKGAGICKKKSFEKMFQGCQPLKQLSAFGKIFSEATHQNWTKFKSCGYFDQKFIFISKFWPFKANKAKKGHVTFFSIIKQ